MKDIQHLYIIGNGFDLYHDLSTSYKDFREYVKKYNKKLFDIVNDIYPSLIREEKNKIYSSSILWMNFEKSLAEIDQDYLWQYIHDNITPYGAEDWGDEDNFRAQHAIETFLNNLTRGLKDTLISWISSIKLETKRKGNLEFANDSFFLTFNYTKTLEKYYKIPLTDILHIHGSIDNPSSIVMGHSFFPPSANNDWDDIRLYECEKIIDKSYFQETYKHVHDIIEANHKFFQSLKNVTNIHIIGPSMNEIDFPYFKEINDNITNKIEWDFYYYKTEDIANCLKQLHDKLHIQYERITILPYPKINE